MMSARFLLCRVNDHGGPFKGLVSGSSKQRSWDSGEGVGLSVKLETKSIDEQADRETSQ